MPPASVLSGKELARLGREALKWLVRTQRYELFESPSLKMVSAPGETEGQFRIRLQQAAREARDAQVEKLREKYAKRIETLQAQIQRAEIAVEREEQEAKQQKLQTAVSFGATLLGAFMGRKAVQMTSLGRATTAVRGVGRTLRAQEDVTLAERKLADLQEKLKELETEFENEVAAWMEKRILHRNRWKKSRFGLLLLERCSSLWRWRGCPSREGTWPRRWVFRRWRRRLVAARSPFQKLSSRRDAMFFCGSSGLATLR
jgi:phage host-nuclease inhibitor protein Gam